MRAMLLGLAAALTTTALPAVAQDRVLTAGPSLSFHGDFGRQHGDRDRHHPRRHRGFGDSVFIYDRDYQGDTVWRSNSFNDWWHDRPDRAYPRWLQTNQNCERPWYAGTTLRC